MASDWRGRKQSKHRFHIIHFSSPQRAFDPLELSILPCYPVRGTFEAPEGLVLAGRQPSFALGWEERCILRADYLAFTPLSFVLVISCHYRKLWAPLHGCQVHITTVHLSYARLRSGLGARSTNNRFHLPSPKPIISDEMFRTGELLRRCIPRSELNKYAVQSFH